MEKYKQIQEKVRNLQHQKNIWRKMSSTVSWKNVQDRKKIIHKEKYRIPYTVNIPKETFETKNAKIFKKMVRKRSKNNKLLRKWLKLGQC